MVEAKSANVVLRAVDFHPGRMDTRWLETNEVFGETELEGATDKVIAPVLVAFRTESIQFLATENRIQITASEPTRSALKRLVNVATALLHAFEDDVEVTGSGLNLVWDYTPQELEDFGGLSAALFLPSECPLAHHFDEPSSEFGTYAERDFEAFRVHLTVKPEHGEEEGIEARRFRCTFNFHREPQGNDSRQDAVAALDAWGKAWEFAETVAQSIAERGEDQ